MTGAPTGAGRALANLAWLDFRLAVNRVRAIRENPRRLVVYLLVGGFFFYNYFNTSRLGAGHPRGEAFGNPLGEYGPRLALVVPGVALLLAGWSMVSQGGRPVAAFASAADGRFLIGSGVSPRVVIAWWVVRAMRRATVSVAFLAVAFGLVYAPILGVSASSAWLAMLAAASFRAVPASAHLAGFFLARRLGFQVVGLVGYVACGLGAASVAAAAARIAAVPLPIDLVGGLNGLPPGSWLLGGLTGDWPSIAALLVLVLILSVTAILLADDCYPELWAASTRVFTYRRALRSGGGGIPARFAARREMRAQGNVESSPAREVASSDGRWAPGDPWVIAWKEWRTLRHSARGGWTVAGGAITGLVAGAAFGLLARGPNGPAIIGTGGGLFCAFTVFRSFASVDMTADLRNPLWWLSGASMVSRLGVWTGTRALRIALPSCALVVGFALTEPGSAGFVAPGVLVLLCITWMFQLIALVAYSVLPARSDAFLSQVLRLGMTYGVLLVVGIPAALVGIVLNSLLAAAVGALVVALPATAGGLILAAARVSGNGQAFVREAGV